MNKRQRKTFALYFLVKAIGYSKAESEQMLKNLELYQLDDIAEKGMKILHDR